MATSSNVIEYSIFDKSGKEVGRHRQNIMCSTCNDGLEKFQPYQDFTIQAWGYDEEDEIWESEKKENLRDWLIKHPSSFTFIPFKEGSIVSLKKNKNNVRGGEAKIIEVLKGKFMPEYLVEYEDGERIIVYQGGIKPDQLV